jgi:hypothetical protein
MDLTPFRGRSRGILWNWAPLILWLLAIYWMSDQPVVPHPGRRIGIADGVTDYGGHMVIFALLAFLAWRVLRAQPTLPHDVPQAATSVLAGLFAAFYAVTDEIHQHFVPGRTASPRDWVADVIGILATCLLVAWCQSQRRRDRFVPLG